MYVCIYLYIYHYITLHSTVLLYHAVVAPNADMVVLPAFGNILHLYFVISSRLNIYGRIYICIYMNTYICVHIYVHIHIYVYTYVCVHIYIHDMRTCTYICAYIRAYICIHICARIHI